MINEENLNCILCNKIYCYHHFFIYDDGSFDFVYKVNEEDDEKFIFEWKCGKLYLCNFYLDGCGLTIENYDLIVDCESIDLINKEFIDNIIKNLVFR